MPQTDSAAIDESKTAAECVAPLEKRTGYPHARLVAGPLRPFLEDILSRKR